MIKKQSKKINNKIKFLLFFLGFFIFGALISGLWFSNLNYKDYKNLDSKLKKDLMKEGKYKCCIKDICTYCLVDEGECRCIDNVVSGLAPCGECLGEILEGEGNPYLREYFEDALVEELGEENREFIRNIILDKYY